MEQRRRIGWLLLFILFVYLASETLVSALIPAPVVAADATRLRVICLEPPAILELEAESIRMEPDMGLEPRDHIAIRWSPGRHFVQRAGQPDLEVEGPIHLTWSGVATWRDGKGPRGRERRDIGSITLTEIEGKRKLWVSVELEDYLSGVLAREMGAGFPLEALKAQAVAARSFALNAAARRRRNGSPWDLQGGQADMVYRGLDSSSKIMKALRETRGLVLAFDEKILRAYFSATCGGKTRDGRERFQDVPAEPFRPVTCQGCEGLGLYRWSRKVDRARIDKVLPGLGKSPLEWQVSTRDARGDWKRFQVRSRGGSWLKADMTRLRGKLGLPSTWITGVAMNGSDVVFKGNGHGHGVGLCQNGAKGYARAGRNYQQILDLYYNQPPLRKIGK